MPYPNLPPSDFLKYGARHSRSDMEALQALHDYACQLGAKCADMPAEKAITETLINIGGAVKAVGANEIEGYMLRWGNESEPDISPERDWFWENTYLGRNAAKGVDLTLNHGIPLTADTAWASDRMIGYVVSTKADNYGVLARAIVDADEDYKKVIMDMVKQGRLRFSSGALSHLVKRTPMANGTNRVDRWPVGELALTPTPAEPRLGNVMALKSYESWLANGQGGSTAAPKPRRVSPSYPTKE